MFLNNPFESIKNVEKYTDQVVMNNCPDCGGDKFDTIRECRRGTNLPDRIGLYCKKCRVLWYNKN